MARLTPKGTLALTAERKPLLDALELAAGATARAATVPALAAVRISAEGGRLVAAGTDSDLWIEAECPARVEGDGVAMAIGADLVRAVKAAGDEPRIELQGERIRVSGSDTTIRLAAMDPADFMEVQDAGDGEVAVRFPGGTLQAALARVLPAVSSEDTRYYLNGIYLQLAGREARLTATDGHRLHHVRLPCEGSPEAAGGILPKRTIAAIARLDATVNLTLTRSWVRLAAGAVVLTSRLIDGQFPDYERVIPDGKGPLRFKVGPSALLAAVRRVGWAAEGKLPPIRLQLEGGALVLDAKRPDAEAETRLDVGGDGSCTWGLNARYLEAALGAVTGDEAELVGINPASPWLILDLARPDDRLVVMPMRV